MEGGHPHGHHHGPHGPFKCPNCQKELPKPEKPFQPPKEGEERKPPTCPFCGKEFPRPPPLKCKKCGEELKFPFHGHGPHGPHGPPAEGEEKGHHGPHGPHGPPEIICPKCGEKFEFPKRHEQ